MRDQSSVYAERVLREASSTSTDLLYCGKHLKDVADYLNQPSSRRPLSRAYDPTPSRPFVHLYKLDDGIGKPIQYSNVGAFEDDCERQQGEIWHRAGLLFLTGHATPEWLNAIGGEFDIDPLHLRRHLSFRPTARLNTFAFPSLPSASTSVLTLTIPTLGNIEPHRHRISSVGMAALRRACGQKIKERSKLQDFQHASTAGEPILRRMHLHDMNTFTIEQDVTISLVEDGSRWTLVVMCDSNGDGSAPDTPLLELDHFSKSQVNLVSVIQMNRRLHVANNEALDAATQSSPSQTLALLSGGYGKMLDPQVISKDPFYTLHELFDFFASAESQFVNMMRQHVNEQVDLAGYDREQSIALSDFQYTSEILNQHLSRLKRLLNLVRNRESWNWPQPEAESLQETANEAFVKLTDDLQYLIDQLDALVQQSDGGKDLVLGRANIVIAEQSFDHNIELGHLTRIGTWVAILYVPWSFLTSVFGMNFREFGQGPLSIWVWAASSAIALMVGILVFSLWKWRWVVERVRAIIP